MAFLPTEMRAYCSQKLLLSHSFSLPLCFFSPSFILWGTHGISLVLLPYWDKWVHVRLYACAITHIYVCVCVCVCVCVRERERHRGSGEMLKVKSLWRVVHNYRVRAITEAAFNIDVLFFCAASWVSVILSFIKCVFTRLIISFQPHEVERGARVLSAPWRQSDVTSPNLSWRAEG